MAVKARAEITLSSIRDVQSVTRYYLLQSSTSAVPSKPTTNPPGGDWVKAEPTYTTGSTNSLYFVDLTVFSDGTFAYSDVSLSSSYEAAKVAYNKAENAEDIAERATHSLNLTPYGSRSFDDTDYWYNVHEYGGVVGSNGVIWNTEQLADGWIHICVDATGYTGTAKYVGNNVVVRTSPSFKLNTLYTILYEVRNNNSVLAETSANNTQFYIQEAASRVFWGGTATEILEGGGTGSGFILRTMAPEANTTYRKRFTKMSDSGTHAGSNPPHLFQMQHRYGAGDYVDFELRISIYEGRYLGDYMPYVVSDVTDLSQIGGRNLYIVKDATDGCIDSSTGGIRDMKVANREQISDFIPVKAGDNLIFQAWAKVTNTGSMAGTAWLGYAFYDSEKVYLGSRPSKYDGTLRADGFTHNYYKISVPEGASYIRCTYRRVLEGKAKLERGVVLTDWTQAPEDLESDISAANALAQSAKDTADGKITTFYAASTATPTATTTGDLWIKTDDGNSLWRWNGTAWVSVDNADIQSALTAAGTAQATADSKIVTFAQATSPTATDVGDIWIDTDDSNRMYRWNGTAWVDVHDPQIAEANEKIDNLQIGGRNLLLGSEHFIPDSGIFSGSTATLYDKPALDGELPYCASGPKYVKVTFPSLTIGEQYAFSCEVARLSAAAAVPVYITINGEEAVKVGTATAAVWTKFNVIFTATSSTTYAKVQVYTANSNGSSGYVGYFRHFKLERGNKATDWTAAPEDIEAEVNAAQETANGKNTVYYQTSAPTGGTYKTNDIWFDTGNGNKMYMWNGSTWVAEQFGNAAISDLSITNAKIANGTIESAKIANLDAGKITAGTMSANRIKGDTLTLGGANNVDGMLKVYDANGTLVGSFTREGLMAITGSIGGWIINSSELTGEWQETYRHFESLLSPVLGLQFEETSTEPGFDAQFLNSIWYGTTGMSFLRRRTVNNAVEQLSAFISADTNSGWDGSGREGQITISPHLRVDGTGIDTPHMRADASYAWDLASGSYIRQPAMIMSGSTTISTGTSSKRATICTIPVEYQTGWRIIPFVTRTYGNPGATPADAGDFYYAYYNSVDHNVCIKLANVLTSGIPYVFDYMIYAVPTT